MAIFGFFKKKKEAAMPEPPKPPSSVQPKTEMPQVSRHVDDLEKPSPPIEGPLFPEIPKLELPELEPAKEEKELVSEETKVSEIVPEHLPEIEEIEAPEEIPEEIPEIETVSYKPKTPVFIDVNVCSEMIEQLNTTRAKLNEYASAAARVMELRVKKDSLMEKWRDCLEDIERKLLGIDRIIFEGR